ncbi:MAG: phosphatase PAP2 family protein [Bacteroidota bacterium]
MTINFWQRIVQWDQYLFKKINGDWTNPLFDIIMPFLREALYWAPLYIFLVVLVLMNFKIKGLWWFVFCLITVALTDMTGTYVFKHGFERLRPCSDPHFLNEVRLLVNQCSAGYSFVSNHAANHFGIAAFFFVTFRHLFKKWVWVGLLWAASIGYAQIYVGVHYPLDVFCGSLLGLAFGITTGTIYNKQFGIAIFGNQLAA